MKKLIRKVVIFAILILVFIVLCIVKENPAYAEFYSRNIASFYIKIAGTVFGWIPFSIYEFTLIGLGIAILFYAITILILLFRRRWKALLHRGLSFLIFTFICVDIYVGTASISYGRSDLPIPQYEGEVSRELIDETFEYFLDDYNEISRNLKRDDSGAVVCPYTFDELNRILKKEYERLDSEYFPSYTPTVKKLLFSRVFSELHFTGIFWAPTGEANVNKDCFPCELPHTMAHEIAHSKGVFRENDANLVGLYITLTSENEFLRYSAYYCGFSSLLDIYYLTDYDRFYENYFRLNPEITNEYRLVSDFWSSHDLLARLGNWYNNLFLKLNGNENGTGDYSDSSTSENTGITDENDRPIYVIKEYSPYQKLFFDTYLNRKN